MSSIEFSMCLASIDEERLAKAREAFLSIDKAFTIRRRKVAGEQQLTDRLTRAIAAYQANSSV